MNFWYFSQAGGSGPDPDPGGDASGSNYKLGTIARDLGRGEVYPVDRLAPTWSDTNYLTPNFTSGGAYQLPTIEGGGTGQGPDLDCAPDNDNVRFSSFIFNNYQPWLINNQMSCGPKNWDGNIYQSSINTGYQGSVPMAGGTTLLPDDDKKYMVFALFDTSNPPVLTGGRLALPIDKDKDHNILNCATQYNKFLPVWWEAPSDGKIKFNTAYIYDGDSFDTNHWVSKEYTGKLSNMRMYGGAGNQFFYCFSPPAADDDTIEWYYWQMQASVTENDYQNQFRKLFGTSTVDRDQCMGMRDYSQYNIIWYKDPNNNKPSFARISTQSADAGSLVGDCWNLNGFGTGKFKLNGAGTGCCILVDYSTNPNSLLYITYGSETNPLLAKVVRISHKTRDLAESSCYAYSDSFSVWAHNDFIYGNIANLGDVTDGDYTFDLIELGTDHSITKAANALEISTTNEFTDHWSGGDEITYKDLDTDTNRPAMAAGNNPEWNFKSDKTLPVANPNDTAAGGRLIFESATPQEFSPIMGQSTNRGTGNVIVSPYYTWTADGSYDDIDDYRWFVGVVTIDTDDGSMTPRKGMTIPFTLTNPDDWSGSWRYPGNGYSPTMGVQSDGSTDFGYYWAGAISSRNLSSIYASGAYFLCKVGNDGELDSSIIVGDFAAWNGDQGGPMYTEDDAIYLIGTKCQDADSGVGSPTRSMVIKVKEDLSDVIWSKQCIFASDTDSNRDYVNAVTTHVDSAGNTYIVGGKTVTRSSGSGTANMRRFFWMKLDSDGDIVWQKQSTNTYSSITDGQNTCIPTNGTVMAFDDDHIYCQMIVTNNQVSLFKLKKSDGTIVKCWPIKANLQPYDGSTQGLGAWKDGDNLRISGAANYYPWSIVLDMTKDPPETTQSSVIQYSSQPASNRPFGLQPPVGDKWFSSLNNNSVYFMMPKDVGLTGVRVNSNAEGDDATVAEQTSAYNFKQTNSSFELQASDIPDIENSSFTVSNGVGKVTSTPVQNPDIANIVYATPSFDTSTWNW